jgi:arsenite methyltransferase
MRQKPDYGIDAPGVIRNDFLFGTLFLIIALVFPDVTIAHIKFILMPGFLWPAGWFFLFGGLMLLYSLVGKFRHRDRMLAKVNWKGDEQVLDVDTQRELTSGMPRIFQGTGRRD